MAVKGTETNQPSGLIVGGELAERTLESHSTAQPRDPEGVSVETHFQKVPSRRAKAEATAAGFHVSVRRIRLGLSDFKCEAMRVDFLGSPRDRTFHRATLTSGDLPITGTGGLYGLCQWWQTAGRGCGLGLFSARGEGGGPARSSGGDGQGGRSPCGGSLGGSWGRLSEIHDNRC